jgi:hypothetical protein
MVTVSTTCSPLLDSLAVTDEAMTASSEGLPRFEELAQFGIIRDQRFWPLPWPQPLAEDRLFAANCDKSSELGATCSS